MSDQEQYTSMDFCNSWWGLLQAKDGSTNSTIQLPEVIVASRRSYETG